MELLLERKTLGPVATIGDLSVDGAFECHTLEDRVREVAGEPVARWKVQNQTAIPAGRYRVVVDFSARFQRPMPHILDVPGFTGVRIHCGNTDADTDGCVLLGQTIGGADFIGASRAAFDAFFPKLEAALARGEGCWLTIQ